MKALDIQECSQLVESAPSFHHTNHCAVAHHLLPMTPAIVIDKEVLSLVAVIFLKMIAVYPKCWTKLVFKAVVLGYR